MTSFDRTTSAPLKALARTLARTLGPTTLTLVLLLAIGGALRPAAAAAPFSAIHAVQDIDAADRAVVQQAGFKVGKGHGYKYGHGFSHRRAFNKRHIRKDFHGGGTFFKRRFGGRNRHYRNGFGRRALFFNRGYHHHY